MYSTFIEQGIARGRKPDLIGGGVIRSLGSWSKVLSLRRRGEKQAYEQRILRDDEFVQGPSTYII